MQLKAKERKVVQRQKRAVVGEQSQVGTVADTETENEAHTALMQDMTKALRVDGHPNRQRGSNMQLFWPFVRKRSLCPEGIRISRQPR